MAVWLGVRQQQAERRGLARETGTAVRAGRDVELAVQVPEMLAYRRLGHGQAGGDLPHRGRRAGVWEWWHRLAQRGENVDFTLCQLRGQAGLLPLR